jgi:hypothetical protein
MLHETFIIHSRIKFQLPDSNDFLSPTCQRLKRELNDFSRIIISHNIKLLLNDNGPVHELYYCPVSLTDAKADGDRIAIVSQIFATAMLLMQTEGN